MTSSQNHQQAAMNFSRPTVSSIEKRKKPINIKAGGDPQIMVQHQKQGS